MNNSNHRYDQMGAGEGRRANGGTAMDGRTDGWTQIPLEDVRSEAEEERDEEEERKRGNGRPAASTPESAEFTANER